MIGRVEKSRIRRSAPGIVLAVMLVTANAAAAVTVKIHPQAEVTAPTIELNEIADIQGAQGDQKVAVEAYYIGFAPQCGQKMTFSRYVLEAKKKDLIRNGIQFADFSIPKDGITVTTKCKELSGEEILSVAEGFIMQRLPWKTEDVEIVRNRVPESIVFPEGEIEIRPQESRIDTLARTPDVKVDIILNGKVIRTLNLGVNITLRVPAVVASRSLRLHDVIGADDLKIVKEDIKKLPRNPVINIQDAVGKRVTHSISQGQLIDMDGIEIPPVILKRDKVTVTLKNGSLEIQTQGTALEDGRPGQDIQVENLDSHTKLMARVVGPGQVEIDMGQ